MALGFLSSLNVERITGVRAFRRSWLLVPMSLGQRFGTEPQFPNCFHKLLYNQRPNRNTLMRVSLALNYSSINFQIHRWVYERHAERPGDFVLPQREHQVHGPVGEQQPARQRDLLPAQRNEVWGGVPERTDDGTGNRIYGKNSRFKFIVIKKRVSIPNLVFIEEPNTVPTLLLPGNFTRGD